MPVVVASMLGRVRCCRRRSGAGLLSGKSRARDVTAEHLTLGSLVLVRYNDDPGWSHERMMCYLVHGDSWATYTPRSDTNEERLEEELRGA